MARSVTATTNGPSKRKEPANGKPSANGSANGAAAAEALDDPGYRDFFWTYTEEPHRTRRLEIIKAHPEVSPACRDTCRQTN
jgi:sphingolipid delta-4 desaturase